MRSFTPAGVASALRLCAAFPVRQAGPIAAYSMMVRDCLASWTGAALASAIMGFLMVRAIRLSIAAIDQRLEVAHAPWAARVSGFRIDHATACAAGIIRVFSIFARGLGEFGATITFVSTSRRDRDLGFGIYAFTQVPGGTVRPSLEHHCRRTVDPGPNDLEWLTPAPSGARR